MTLQSTRTTRQRSLQRVFPAQRGQSVVEAKASLTCRLGHHRGVGVKVPDWTLGREGEQRLESSRGAWQIQLC